MQTARDLYDRFGSLTANKTSTGDMVGAGVSGAGLVGGVGLASNSLYDLSNLSNNADNPVAVTYGYRKGRGAGHKNMAETYAKILNNSGIKAEAVTHGLLPSRASNYSAHIPAGYGPRLSDVPTLSFPTDYAPGATKPLPFAEANALGGSSAKAKALALRELASKYGFGDDTRHIITLAAGETGSALTRKLQALLEATAHRKDVGILALAANAPDDVKNTLAQMGAGRVKVVGALPKDDFLKHLSSSSLNIGYGGSSSITEQLGMRNPQLNLFIDRALNPVNTNNIDFAQRYGGIDAMGVKDVDALKARINDVLDNSDAYARDSQVKQHLGAARSARSEMLKNINKLRGSNLTSRMSKYLGRLHGGLGLATVGGLGLNYYMNKKSAFMSSSSDDGSKLTKLLGGAALGAGAMFMPAALPMLRIGARGQLAKLYAAKSTPEWLRTFAGKHQGNAADFIADYTEGARRLGELPGVRPFIDKWFDFKTKHIPVKPGQPSHDFQKAHYKRFMSGSNREGMKHWAWEVGQDFENKAIANAAKKLGITPAAYRKLPEFDPNSEEGKMLSRWHTSLGKAQPGTAPRSVSPEEPAPFLVGRPWYQPRGAHARLERGRQAVLNPGGLFDDAVHKGMSEYEAIKELGKSSDPAVKSFLRALAAHKVNASKVYTAQALAAPGLLAGGAALTAYQPEKPTSFIDKLRASFPLA